MVHAASIVLALAADPSEPPASDGLHLHRLGTHATGVFDRSASEIAAFHAPTRRLWVVNGAAGIDVLDIADPASPGRHGLRLSSAGSVARLHIIVLP